MNKLTVICNPDPTVFEDNVNNFVMDKSIIEIVYKIRNLTFVAFVTYRV